LEQLLKKIIAITIINAASGLLLICIFLL